MTAGNKYTAPALGSDVALRLEHKMERKAHQVRVAWRPLACVGGT